jgi:hypothetical protein
MHICLSADSHTYTGCDEHGQVDVKIKGESEEQGGEVHK